MIFLLFNEKGLFTALYRFVFVFFSDRKTNTCWVFSCCLGNLKFEIVVITLWRENRTLWDPSLLWIFYSNHRLSGAITQVCSSLTSYYTSSGYWSGNGAHRRLPLATGCQHGKLPSAALNPCLIDNNYRQNPPYHRDTAQQLLNMAHSKNQRLLRGIQMYKFYTWICSLHIHLHKSTPLPAACRGMKGRCPCGGSAVALSPASGRVIDDCWCQWWWDWLELCCWTGEARCHCEGLTPLIASSTHGYEAQSHRLALCRFVQPMLFLFLVCFLFLIHVYFSHHLNNK